MRLGETGWDWDMSLFDLSLSHWDRFGTGSVTVPCACTTWYLIKNRSPKSVCLIKIRSQKSVFLIKNRGIKNREKFLVLPRTSSRVIRVGLSRKYDNPRPCGLVIGLGFPTQRKKERKVVPLYGTGWDRLDWDRGVSLEGGTGGTGTGGSSD